MSDQDTAEILETQVALLERFQSQATQTLLSQATISKRQLLNFVNNASEFAADFMALNQRTINLIRRKTDDQDTVVEGATGQPAREGEADASTEPGLEGRQADNRPDVGGDAGRQADIQTDAPGSEGLHDGPGNRQQIP